MSEAKSHGNKLIALFDAIDSRDDAAELIGEELFIDRAWLAEAAPNEYYWADLIGLEVINREGFKLGRVVNLLETGANDVMVVEGDRQRLIPFVHEIYVLEVNLSERVLRVDWHCED